MGGGGGKADEAASFCLVGWCEACWRSVWVGG